MSRGCWACPEVGTFRGWVCPLAGYIQKVGMSRRWVCPSGVHPAPWTWDIGYHGIPWDTVGKQAVRILQECFLVVIELVSELKMTTFQKRN